MGQNWVECWVPGRPRGKARPRARMVGGHVRVYTVKEDVLTENWTRACWMQQVGLGLGQRPAADEASPLTCAKASPRAGAKASPRAGTEASPLTGAKASPPLERDGGPVTGPVEVRLTVYVACPASKPRAWRAAALAGLIRPTTKPDTDNVAKLYLDGLNGTAWLDDAQVVELSVGKWYGESPGVLIRVRQA